MDDISQKIGEILNDEESMERVRQLASSFLGEKEDAGEDSEGAKVLKIMEILEKLKNSSSDREKLLVSLRPLLSDSRKTKVDTAVKLIKIIELLPLIKESGIIGDLL